MSDNEIIIERPQGDSGPTTSSGRQLLSRNIDYPVFQRLLVYLADQIAPALKLSAGMGKGFPGVHFYVVSSSPVEGKGPRQKGITQTPITQGDGDREQLVEIYGQTFLYNVQFNACAEDAMDAEKLMAQLEDFIEMAKPTLIENGVKKMVSDGRNFDAYVVDLHKPKSITSVRYLVKIDKIIMVPVAKLADIQAEVQTLTLQRIFDLNEDLRGSIE